MPIALKKSNIISKLNLDTSSFSLATVHRAENVDNPKILANFIEIFEHCPVPVLLPLHPRTVKNAKRFGLWKHLSKEGNIRIIDPVGYWSFLVLMRHCSFILTDSGGIQEEATAPNIRKKCFILRTSTERQEAVLSGFADLVGVNPKAVIEAVTSWLDAGARVPDAESPFGDGNAAKRSVEIMKKSRYMS